MKRGDIWIVAGGSDYAGKARPAVILQDDSFGATNSITVCAFTTDPTDAPLFRLAVEPNERNDYRPPPGSWSIFIQRQVKQPVRQAWLRPLPSHFLRYPGRFARRAWG